MSTKKYFMVVYGGIGTENTTMKEQIKSIITMNGHISIPENTELTKTKIDNLFFIVDESGKLDENCVARFYRFLLITGRDHLKGDITDSLYVKEVSSCCSDF